MEPIGSWETLENAYSIGELIEFLPKKDDIGQKGFEFDGRNWFVDWDIDTFIYQTMRVELIDALYDMCVELKERRVI